LKKNLVDFLNQKGSFLITSHIEPDGDAIGALIAISMQLEKMSKKTYILSAEPVPERYRFLKYWEKVNTKKPDKNIHFDAAIFLDVADTKRVSWVYEFIKEKTLPVLNIDHHESNTLFGKVNYVDKHASSTCECIYNIFSELKIDMSIEICECIATGIITDTGRFSFKNTGERTFRICSELSHCGVDFYSLTNKIYHTRSVKSIRLLSSVLSTLKVKNGIAFIRLTREMLKNIGAREEESEGFVNFILSIRDIKAAAFLREKSNGKTRVSLRSKSEGLDVNKIAYEFNGGGHKNAAGFRSTKEPDILEKEIVNAFKRYK
jgi:phosphoesterase RecJ-like protein